MTERSAPKIFSHPVLVAEVPEGGLDVSLSADADTLRSLADADELQDIASLDAEFHVARRPGERFNVSGEMRARVTQICVVSLEPFESEIVEPIDVDFAPPDEAAELAAKWDAAAAQDAAHIDPGEDPPDPIVNGQIDLGALAIEFLALGLDPYPRKPGVTFEPPPAGESAPETPFSVLKQLKERS
ncbi:MAG TPA: DUF177 domain-containing protein [Methylovirgula sp.]|jgi:uncharacterized metal-binding protein YceD (DUF177 family)